MRVDERAFGHHPVGWERPGVGAAAVLEADHPVDARDRGQLDSLAGVVLSGDQAPSQVGQRGRLDGRDHRAVAGFGFGVVQVDRGLAPGVHDGGLHLHSSVSSGRWFLWKQCIGGTAGMTIWFP